MTVLKTLSITVVFNVDTTTNRPQVHPTCFCKRCYAEVQYAKVVFTLDRLVYVCGGVRFCLQYTQRVLEECDGKCVGAVVHVFEGWGHFLGLQARFLLL